MNYWIFIPVIVMIVSYVELLDEMSQNLSRKNRVILWSTSLFVSTVLTLLMLSSDVIW